jgi:hypothetical protein
MPPLPVGLTYAKTPFEDSPLSNADLLFLEARLTDALSDAENSGFGYQ